MLADKLRKSVLQSAIQGKLTEQLATDDKVEDLLQAIEEEKELLIKEKKIKKQKPLPEITEDEIPFAIPENWKWVRLGEIGIWEAGTTPSRSKSEYYINGKIPWVKTGDLTDSILKSVTENITQLALEETSLKIKPVGSVLIAMYGATIGKVSILGIEATTNQACCACVTYKNIYNKYIFYYLISQRDNLKKMGAGGAQPNISREKIIKTIMPLPPLAEQKRIVEKLDNVLANIDELKASEEKLSILQKNFPDKLKKSILQSAIQGKLTEQLATDDKVEDLLQAIKEEKERLIKEKKIKKQKPLPEITEEEIPFEIPKNWRWVRLGALSSVITDGTHKTPNYVNKGIPFISVQNISSGKYKDTKLKYITEDEHKKLICRCKPEKGDILFCRIGTLGHPYIVDLDFEFSIFVSLGLIKLINKDINVYLKAYMDSPSFEWQINKVKVGGGTHTFKLNLKDIVNFLIPLPPLAEQKRIVEKLDKLLADIEELKI
ncbi:restriction endonuclease [Megamonas funiformis]|uniref:restriction endonuclease subunit S n=1 Tax=Megamonas funiformis TaxID=437897 RepID=UPI0014305B8D|nr:restriction endonuclease subunit S [Megamonas funiformis]NJE27529.1 restriction endonuclease [Megamonas funiformis]